MYEVGLGVQSDAVETDFFAQFCQVGGIHNIGVDVGGVAVDVLAVADAANGCVMTFQQILLSSKT